MSVSSTAGSHNTYCEAANEYIQRIRQYSPSAAHCIEQIQSQYGVRAAYLAGFALMMLKDHVNQSGYSSPNNALKSFTYYDEMQMYAGAIALYVEAAKHLLAFR
jgi:hypothetical protein